MIFVVLSQLNFTLIVLIFAPLHYFVPTIRNKMDAKYKQKI